MLLVSIECTQVGVDLYINTETISIICDKSTVLRECKFIAFGDSTFMFEKLVISNKIDNNTDKYKSICDSGKYINKARTAIKELRLVNGYNMLNRIV